MKWLLALSLLAGCDSPSLPGASDGAVPDLARASVDGGGAPANHRADDSQCAGTPGTGNCSFSGGMQACGGGDSACTAGTNGRCVESMGGALFCFCTYDKCTHDGDCPSGQLCACHGSPFMGGNGNTCTDGNCRVDSDCGPPGYCSPSHGNSGCGALTGYYCHTTSDLCTDDSDCTPASGLDVCAWSPTNKRWECQQQLLCA